MIKIKHLLLLACFTVCFTACKKNDVEVEPYDFVAQLKKDTAIINAFVKNNNITGGTLDPESGIYYKIIKPGSGTVNYGPSSSITARYVGRLLDGTVFDNVDGAPIQFTLGRTIPGWQWGIQKIQKGGEIRLIVPSGYAYQNAPNGPIIKANSILDFDITLVDVVE